MKRKHEYRPRHQCPECREAGRKRMLSCSVILIGNEYRHYIQCPDHGAKVARCSSATPVRGAA